MDGTRFEFECLIGQRQVLSPLPENSDVVGSPRQ